MDFILICFIIFYNSIALFINLRLIYIFEDAEDSKGKFLTENFSTFSHLSLPNFIGFFSQALVTRIITILGLQLIWINFMLVPVNIINEYPIIGSQEIRTISMRALFMVVMYLNILFTSLVIPFSILYYETQFDTKIGLNRSYTPYLASFLSTLICWIFIGGNYAIFKEIHLVGVTKETCLRLSLLGYINEANCTGNTIIFNGTFSIATSGLLLFIGYIFNVIFIGIASVLIPINYLISIIRRPKPIDIHLYQQKKQEIYIISKALSNKGEDLKRRYDQSSKGLESEFYTSTYLKSWQETRTLKQKIYKYKSEVLALSSYFENLEERFRTKGQNFIFIITKLAKMFFTLILTVSIYATLIVQLTVKNPPNYSGNQFINMIFILFSIVLPLYIGSCICYTWNLLAKKVCYCLPIHVLVKSQTPMNSMIFIIGIVLIPVLNIIYITNLSNSWLFKSDLYYIFLLASNTKLNYKLIPNQVLIYSFFGVSICSIIIHLFSFLWDKGISIQEEIPKILTKYLNAQNSGNSKK
ncbi:integral membrane with 9 transmembrane domains [Cryptosporidium sp. chipmunk genotype I]|uniref:integral membrane with 9 transmembrane domains n=1 Tax=Cryptosporidium sp. chipmunk genotype I TaxID=1280935 RepID=UPI00351A5971|nr:integral membrane with 9 transmembrane domains [Cryptosporidium sp. chipmunk genotype I]